MLKLAIYTLSYAYGHHPTTRCHPLLLYIPARTSAAAAPPTIHPAFPVIIGTPAVLEDEAPAVPEAVEEPDAALAAVPELAEVARVELPEVVLVADVFPDFPVEVEPVAAEVAVVEAAELAALPIAPAVSVTTASPNSKLIFVTVVVVVLDVVFVPITPFKSPLQTPVFAAVIVQPTSIVLQLVSFEYGENTSNVLIGLFIDGGVRIMES